MPTLEKQIREYRKFGRLAAKSDRTRTETSASAQSILCEQGKTIPRGWFVVRKSSPKRSEWRTFVYRRKPVPGGWLEQAPSQRRQTRQRKNGIPKSIEEAIASSRSILDLQDDWDEQGSPGYDESTWRRACDFLVRQASFARERVSRDLPPPRILPGPDGSIDLHWKMPRFELLVNVPKDASKPATFYGDDYGNSCVRGNLNTSEQIRGLVVWLLS